MLEHTYVGCSCTFVACGSRQRLHVHCLWVEAALGAVLAVVQVAGMHLCISSVAMSGQLYAQR